MKGRGGEGERDGREGRKGGGEGDEKGRGRDSPHFLLTTLTTVGLCVMICY